MSYIVAVDSGGTFCDCVVTDENGKVTYTEQVPEITQEPDYEAALQSLK